MRSQSLHLFSASNETECGEISEEFLLYYIFYIMFLWYMVLNMLSHFNLLRLRLLIRHTTIQKLRFCPFFFFLLKRTLLLNKVELIRNVKTFIFIYSKNPEKAWFLQKYYAEQLISTLTIKRNVS